MTGCTDINSQELGLLIDEEVNSSLKLANQVAKGYKYYLPKGVMIKEDNDFNQKFMLLNSYMYLYVDIVSYYYKNDFNYEMEKDYNYYQKELVHGDKKGYVVISKENDNYFVKVVYNYAKCEVYTNKSNLSSVVSYAMIILDSIEYNDVLIDKIISDTSVSTSDVTYEINKPNDSESKFSQYLNEYVQEETTNNVLPDEYKNE